MIIIGINEGVNSSVVVSKNEKIIFAIQEERLNKQKEYAGFPILSIKYANLIFLLYQSFCSVGNVN